MYLDVVPKRAHVELLIVSAMDYDVMPWRGKFATPYLSIFAALTALGTPTCGFIDCCGGHYPV
jgi:hypothetical protein